MSLPAGIEVGYVRWQGLVTMPDQLDLDDRPDAEASQGTVEFVPGTPELRLAGVTLFVPTQVYGIGSDGILRDAEGRERVTLISPESAGINPPDWNWTAIFKLSGGLSWGPVTFDLPPGAEVDLSDVAPVPPSSGTPIVRGEKGDQGEPGFGLAASAVDAEVADRINDVTSLTRAALDEQLANVGVNQATNTSFGIIQLAGDLAGFADAPTVPALADKADAADLAEVATSGSYGDLTGIPTLATVATSGSYNDLSNKPTIPTAPLVVRKTADTSRASTTTLANDPDLFFSSVTPGTYVLDGLVPFMGDGSADVKVLLAGTATVTQWMNFGGTDPSNTPDGQGAGLFYSAGQPTGGLSRGISASSATIGAYGVQFYGTVTITATGSYGLQWAQNVTSATATVAKAGAFLRLTKIA